MLVGLTANSNTVNHGLFVIIIHIDSIYIIFWIYYPLNKLP